MNTPEIMIDLLWTLMNIYHAINPSKALRISCIPWNVIIRNNTIETTKQSPVWDERQYIKSGGGLCAEVKYSLNQLRLRWHWRSQRSWHTPFGQCDLWPGKADINFAMSRTAALPTHPYTYSSTLSALSLPFLNHAWKLWKLLEPGKLRSTRVSPRLFLKARERHIATRPPAVEKLTVFAL